MSDPDNTEFTLGGLLAWDTDSEEYLNQKEFHNHYAEILKGEHPDFRLVAFQVHCDYIMMYFARNDFSDYHFLAISNPANLALTFTGPRTRLGFDPTYKVRFSLGEMYIIEDMGYIRRELERRIKDPSLDLTDDNAYFEITEYAGI